MALDDKRELRVLNRNFSLGEYGESWSKIERYLFIEIYNVIKEFYIAKSADNIETFSSESILVKLPINMLDKKLFSVKNRSKQLLDAAEGLMNKKIKSISIAPDGQYGFDFIAMFPEIKYTPSVDKNHMYIRILSGVYEEMVPIESYCQLDLRLLSEFNSGNTIRLYEIFKSYAFKHKFELTFSDLRKKLGFFTQEKYTEWKHFNAKVLKPAVNNINQHKQYDIEIEYVKRRGSEVIEFRVISHRNENQHAISVLSLDEFISPSQRKMNMIQEKYVSTLVMYCQKTVEISDVDELKTWILSDLIIQQQKKGPEFNFRHSMNAISEQIRTGIYREPYAHKHLNAPIVFDENIHDDIKKMEYEGDIDAIKLKYSSEQITVNQFEYLLH